MTMHANKGSIFCCGTLIVGLLAGLGACGEGLPPSGFGDVDGDGYSADVDCNDHDASTFPGAAEICNGLDDNCDGVIDEGLDGDNDGVTRCGPDGLAGSPDDDCDDGDARVGPGFDELCDALDNDCDGRVDEGFDGDNDGVTVCGPDGVWHNADDDCDDSRAQVTPGASELCDGLDNNCDGQVDEGFDGDGDGYTSCGADGLTGTPDDDCNDGDDRRAPGLQERCDGVDNDCDSMVDEGFDVDLDGVTRCGPDGLLGTADDDCDDFNPLATPGASELCDAIDNNCDGVVDEGHDADGDGATRCGFDGRLGTADDDCNDGSASQGPGFVELCDGLDNNCDGAVDEGFDFDADGVTRCGADGVLGTADDDCDDLDPRRAPGAAELCDGVDNDCDGDLPDDEIDGDFDGYTPCEGDCDDTTWMIRPGRIEIPCNDRDEDCDPLTRDRGDFDGDGVDICDGDCEDASPLIHPGAAELCDGLDNDCDGMVDENFDLDFDGYATCGGDCDDGDRFINPWQIEICDGVDNNCDGAVDEGFGDGDGDGLADCLDAEDTLVDCGDGLDNDGDSFADCLDSDCAGVGPCPTSEICFNLGDDDGDGLIDCSDPDCLSNPECMCNVVTTIDCGANSTFYGEFNGPEATDTMSVYDCTFPLIKTRAEVAVDFVAPYDGRFTFLMRHPTSWRDVDLIVLDGAVGCRSDACLDTGTYYGSGVERFVWWATAGERLILVAEADSSWVTGVVLEVESCEQPAPEICDDDLDNDLDDDTDCEDADCVGHPNCIEDCSDGVDNDINGFTDCYDAQCVGDPACPLGNCCISHAAPGCQVPVVEACVCAADSWCCSWGWDSYCTFLIEWAGCGSCG